MNENIKKLEEIYSNTRLDYFVMAISHLMDIGWSKAELITDEQLEQAEGNGFMTKEFVVWINKTAREIAKACEPSELICFCQYHDLFDTNCYEDARQKKIELAKEAIDDLSDEYEIDTDLGYDLDNFLCDVEKAMDKEEVNGNY